MAPSSCANVLLAALSDENFALLQPHLKKVVLAQHQVLQQSGVPAEHVYFPLLCLVSLVALLENGETVEVAAIGREGAVGARVSGRPHSLVRAIVQLPGTALRMAVIKFQQLAHSHSFIADITTAASDTLLANILQTAVCGSMHEIEARLACRLLHAADRFDSPVLPLTQDFLAQMLGVRRTTVTVAARSLQKRELLRYRRGKMQILNRKGMEAASCECYRTARGNLEKIRHPPRP